MKILFAGVNNKIFGEAAKGQNVLSTYWETKGWKGSALAEFKEMFKFKSLFLDCGAYSAWTQGETLDLGEYIEYIKENEGAIDEYPQLDVKGDFEATKKNLIAMEAEGLKPIPVFHMTNMPVSYFKELVDKGYTRIALGAMAGEGGQAELLQLKLNTIFNYIIDKPTRTVKVKLHAFGATGIDFLLRYPFWTADSTSWLAGAIYGNIYYFDQRTRKIVNGRDVKKFKKIFGKLPEDIRSPDIMFGRGKTHRARLRLALGEFLKLEEYVTQTWEARGIKFIT